MLPTAQVIPGANQNFLLEDALLELMIALETTVIDHKAVFARSIVVGKNAV